MPCRRPWISCPSHLFNWKLWPDFREIPDVSHPWLQFKSLPLGSSVTLGARTLSTLPAHHAVPACGYRMTGETGSIVFTGDTTHSEALLRALNALPDLRHLIIETSFENALKHIAIASKHHWPDSLAEELSHLRVRPQVWITHLKPGNEDAIMAELKQAAPDWNLKALAAGQVLEI